MNEIDVNLTVAEIMQDDFRKNIRLLIRQLCIDFGQRMESIELDAITNRVTFLMYQKFKSFRYGVIIQVFDNATVGEYGTKKVSVSSIMSWISAVYSSLNQKNFASDNLEKNTNSWKELLKIETSDLHAKAMLWKIEQLNSEYGIITKENYSEYPLQRIINEKFVR